MVRGHPYKGMYWVTRILAVPCGVNSTAVTGNMSARRLKRSVNSRKGAEVVNTDGYT